MQPWQQRVVDEKLELDGRLERLEVFLENPANEINDESRDMLVRQQAAMQEYSSILAERIEHF